MRFLLPALVLAFVSFANAEPARLDDLADTRTWRTLLHYDAGGVFATRSAVIDEAFFLHGQGATRPLAELRATVDALRNPDDQTLPARCRFPARTRFLERALDERFPPAACPALETWRDRHAGGRIGLTFVNGYMGNPASFFGHLLLHVETRKRFDGETPGNARVDHATRLLDTSINFGADIPDDEGLATYMAKGLLGGYDARYSQTNFYRNSSVYSEREMRDLWIYDLNLSDSEQALLIDHLYEVMDRDYKYLFLSQNCASRIARTLRLVSPGLETPGSNALWTTPESVVIGAADAKTASGAALVDDIAYVPSRGAITDHAWARLPKRLQRVAKAYWPQPDQLSDGSELAELTVSERARLLDVLLSHQLWLQNADGGVPTGDVRSRLLRARAQLPPGGGLPDPPEPTLIHEAVPPATFRLGISATADDGASALIAGRLLQYDLLDAASPRLTGASLEFGAFEIEADDDDLSLREATIASVSVLKARRSGLPGLQQQIPWYASLDIKRSDFATRRSLDGRATLLAGASSRQGDWLAYGLLGPQLATTRHQAGVVAAGVRTGVLGDWSADQRSHAFVTHRNAFRGADGRRTRVNIAHRVALARRQDIRVELTLDPDSGGHRSSVSLGFYFP
jgi:hypothetical protein